MRIVGPLGDLCIQNGAVTIELEECEGDVTFEWVTPDGEPELAIVSDGADGYSITPPTQAGSYLLTVTCCDV